jgi:prophage regulatory protein
MSISYTIFPGREVDSMCSFTKSTRYREIAAGRFPRPVQLTKGRVGWRSDEVVAWLEGRQRAAAGSRNAA